MLLYFSATGNCKYVTERLAKEFDDKALSIEENRSDITLSENEMLGIVTPVYWWELPIITRDYLKRISVSAPDKPYSFIVTTYGTTPGCTYYDAKRALKNSGVTLCAGFSVKMPDNWTPDFDLSNPEKVKKELEEAEGYIERVIDGIRKGRRGNRMQRKAPYFVRLFSDPAFNKKRRTENFYVEESCIGCGLCKNGCPSEAIEIKNGKPVWVKESCNLCLRCLHRCPAFAIQYGDGSSKLHGQYTNPNVKI